MTKRENAVVSHMACWGEGVWVSYRTISSLELWHTVTKNSLQDINIKDTITGILSGQLLTSGCIDNDFLLCLCCSQ